MVKMPDAYQTFYDAVRSQMLGERRREAIDILLRDDEIKKHFLDLVNAIPLSASGVAAMYAPSAIYRPSIKIDGFADLATALH